MDLVRDKSGNQDLDHSEMWQLERMKMRRRQQRSHLRQTLMLPVAWMLGVKGLFEISTKCPRRDFAFAPDKNANGVRLIFGGDCSQREGVHLG